MDEYEKLLDRYLSIYQDAVSDSEIEDILTSLSEGDLAVIEALIKRVLKKKDG